MPLYTWTASDTDNRYVRYTAGGEVYTTADYYETWTTERQEVVSPRGDVLLEFILHTPDCAPKQMPHIECDTQDLLDVLEVGGDTLDTGTV